MGGNYNYNLFLKKVLSTQIAITVIYTCNMFVLFCACDVMNGMSVKKKNENLKKKKYKKKKKSPLTRTEKIY